MPALCGMVARIFIAARYLFDRLSQPRTRAEEAREVRLRLARQAGPRTASLDEARIALELRALREGLCVLFEDMQACRRCVRQKHRQSGHRFARTTVATSELRRRRRARLAVLWQSLIRQREATATQWAGGHCCSGPTRNLFTDEELAALRLSGTTPHVLRLPRGAHAGCAFRGPLGCSLDAAHRPSLCVRYTCRALEAEIGRGRSRSAVRDLQRKLGAQFERFVAARHARLEQEDLAELLASSPDRT
jgi:hypothetical protein